VYNARLHRNEVAIFRQKRKDSERNFAARNPKLETNSSGKKIPMLQTSDPNLSFGFDISDSKLLRISTLKFRTCLLRSWQRSTLLTTAWCGKSPASAGALLNPRRRAVDFMLPITYLLATINGTFAE
jgi:hypothetical protein